jgi:DNA-binding MarR family transcriptional regulator
MNSIQHSNASTKALDRLLELTVLLNDDMTDALRREGLTVARTHLLWALHQRGPCTQRALAGELNVTPRNITGLVDGLAKTGHITREPHPTDRRSTLVTLTRTGASVMEGMARGHLSLATRLFGELSPAELEAFAGTTAHVSARLRDALATEHER